MPSENLSLTQPREDQGLGQNPDWKMAHALGKLVENALQPLHTQVKTKENHCGFQTIFKTPPQLALGTPRFQIAVTLNWT